MPDEFLDCLLAAILIVIMLALSGCTDYESKAVEICSEHNGIKGYQVRWGFNVVVCNDWHKQVLD